MIVGAVRRYLNLEAAYGFGFPTVVMVSLSGAENLSLRVPTEFRSGYYPTPALREATVTFPEILLAERPADLPTVLRPLLNSIWNAFAWPTCSLFDGAGQWRGPQM